MRTGRQGCIFDSTLAGRAELLGLRGCGLPATGHLVLDLGVLHGRHSQALPPGAHHCMRGFGCPAASPMFVPMRYPKHSAGYYECAQEVLSFTLATLCRLPNPFMLLGVALRPSFMVVGLSRSAAGDSYPFSTRGALGGGVHVVRKVAPT